MNKKDIKKTFHHWILYKKTRIGKRTLPNYWSVQKNLHGFMESTSYKYIEDIRIPFMKQFNDFLYKKFKASHIKRNLNTVQAFIKWCKYGIS